MAVVGGEVFIDILPNMVGFDAALEEGLREHTDAVVADNPGMFDGLAAGVETAERDVTDSLGGIGLAAEGVGDTFARVGADAAAGWQESMGAVSLATRDVAAKAAQDSSDLTSAWTASLGGAAVESRKFTDSLMVGDDVGAAWAQTASGIGRDGTAIKATLEGVGEKGTETASIFDRISSSIGSGFQRAANTMQMAGIPLSGELNEIGNKFKEAETNGSGFVTTMSAVGGLTVASAAVAGAAFLDMGSKFQTTTTQMAASGNIPINLANQIGQAFLHSGSDVVYSAKEQEEAYGAVAGQMAAVQGHVLTVTQTTEFMSHAMDLAEESGQSLKSATADLSGEMQAFQIPLGGVASASTDLFNASRITGVGIDSLSSTLDRMKARLGVAAPSLTDLSSMLVDLAEHGVTGSRGLMVVNTAMTTLLKSTQTLQDAQEKANAAFGTKQAAAELAVVNATKALSAAEDAAHPSATTLAADHLKLAEAQEKLTALVKDGVPALTGSAAAIQALGLQVYNSHGQFVGMDAVIGQLQPKLEHLTEQQQLSALGAVFGASANKALLDTVLAGPAAYDKANKAVTDAAAAHQALVVQQQTLGHEFESIKVIVEDFGTVIGLKLLPLMHDALQGFADFVGFIMDHKVVLDTLGAVIGLVLVGALAAFAVSMTTAGLAALGAALPFTAVGAAAGEAAIGISAASATIVLATVGIAAIGIAVYELTEHFGLLHGLMIAGAAAVLVLAGAFIFLDAVPVVALVVGIGLAVAGLVAGIVDLVEHWSETWADIRSVTADAVDFLSAHLGFLAPIFDGITKAAEPLIRFFEGMASDLAGPITAVVDVFAALPGEIARFAEAIPSFFEKLPGRIVSFFVGLPGRILAELEALPDQLLDLALNLLITWPILLVREAIVAGIAIVRGLVDGLTVAVPAVFDWFVGLPARILSLSLDIGSIGVGMIGDIVDGLGDGAAGLWHFFTDIPGDIAGIFSGGGGKTKGAPSGGAGKAALHNAGSSIIDSILTGLGDAVVGIFTWFLELPGRILDHIAAGTGDQFNRAGAAFVRAILDGMAGAAGDVGDFFANVWGDVASTTAVVWQPVVAVITDVWDAIYTVVHAIWTGIHDYLTVEWTILSTTARVLWAIVYYVIIEVWQLIDEGIRAAWGATSGWVTTAWDAFAGVAATAWDAVYGAVVGVWDRLTAGIEDVWTAISGWLTAAWDAYADVATAAWNAISAAVLVVWDLLLDGVEVIWDALRDFLKSEWSAFLAVATVLWQPISVAITAIWSAMDALIRAIWADLRDFLRAEWAVFAATASILWGAVSAGVTVVWHLLDTGIRGVWAGLDTFLTTAWAAFAKTATLAWDGIVGGIGQAWGALTGIASTIWGGVKAAFVGGANDVIKVLNDFIGLLRDIPGVKQAGLKLIPLIGGGGGGSPASGGIPAAGAGVPGLAAGGTWAVSPAAASVAAAAMPALAAGATWGVYNTPTVLVGEGSRHHPEVVIPTDPAYRANAVGLISTALTMMSYSGGPGRAKGPAFADGGIFNLTMPALAEGGVIDARSFPVGTVAGLRHMADGGIVGSITGAVGSVGSAVGSAVGSLGSAAGSAASGIGGALSSIGSAFTGLASEAAGWVLGAISKAMIEPMENLAITGMERLPEPISGIGVTVVKAIADFITSQKPVAGAAGGVGGASVPYSGSGGVAQWTPVATAVANALGQPGAVGAILRRIQFESGGDPNVVNKWDSNWKAGHPSVGLAQVIHGTFDEYAGQYINTGPFSYGVSIDPMANVYAGMNYATHDYGSIAAVDPLVRPVGYDQGGILPPGLTLAFNNTGRDEHVISPSGAGGGGITIAPGAVQVEVNVGAGAGSDLGSIKTTVQSAITDALGQLMEIAGSAGAFSGSR